MRIEWKKGESVRVHTTAVERLPRRRWLYMAAGEMEVDQLELAKGAGG